MYKALTIAGSDSSGGAGIQADLKTMTALNVYGMSVVTALTAQNTTGVTGIFNVPPEFVAQQMDAVFTDIYPDAVKIGMLSGKAIMEVVASKLIQYKATQIVLDPVMVATSGSRLMQEDSTEFMKNELFPLARIITPNIPETEVLTGMTIRDQESMVAAGRKLFDEIASKKNAAGHPDLLQSTDVGHLDLLQSTDAGHPELLQSTDAGHLEWQQNTATSQSEWQQKTVNSQSEWQQNTAVLVKGGHSIEDANDVLIEDGVVRVIRGQRINNPNTHGTGCTLSSAIASFLAQGDDLFTAVTRAKEYISGALSANLDLGKGSGPLNHMWKNQG